MVMENLETCCHWRLNYERHYVLPLNWEKNRCCHYRLTADKPPVTSIHCDCRKLSIGHADGTVVVLNVDKVPYYCYQFEGLLNERVTAIRVSGRYCVLQQCMLLQIFEDEYFVDAKSFDLGLGMIEIIQRSGLQPEEINDWYKPSRYKDVFFDIYEGSYLLATFRDAQCVYMWSLANGKRVNTIHIRNSMCKLRDMYIKLGKIYIIYAATKRVRHICVYDIESEKWLYEVTTPLCKTQKVICSDSMLIGIAVAGPALTCTGVINVWDLEDGKLISTKFTAEYLTQHSVTTAYDVIIYCGLTSVYIWEPRSDTIIQKLTTMGSPILVKTLPYVFLAVFTDRIAHVFDWYRGTRRFRLFSRYNPDTPEFLFSDETMIILIDEQSCVQMIGFC